MQIELKASKIEVTGYKHIIGWHAKKGDFYNIVGTTYKICSRHGTFNVDLMERSKKTFNDNNSSCTL